MTLSLPPVPSSRILVVEDERSISDVVATALEHYGHSVTQISDGRKGFEQATEGGFDLLVLDVMLPFIDGFEICRRLREQGLLLPVLFLTARDESEDRIKGFRSGGDDYLAKPFRVEELVLRVHAILRRTDIGESRELLIVGDLTLDLDGQEVRRGNEAIMLTATEFRLLHYLMINAQIVVSKAQILAHVWDADHQGSDNIVELYIGYLRRKVDDGRSQLIHTRRGSGYLLREIRE